MKIRTLLPVLLVAALLAGCALPGQVLYRLNVKETVGPVTAEPTTQVAATVEATESEPAAGTATSSLEGRWEGTLSVAGVELDIDLTFTQQDDLLTGFIDIPQQGASDIPLDDITVELPSVQFSMLPAPQTALFEGELDGDTLSGSFLQSGIEGTFEVTRAAGAEAAPSEEVQTRYEDPEGLFSVPVPSTWTLDEYENYARLTSPEGGITIYVLAVAADSALDGIEAAWQVVDPEFALEPQETQQTPPSFPGIEETFVVTYDSDDDDQLVVAGADLLEGIAYVQIIDASLIPFQQRVSQIQVIGSGWEIYALDETDLTGVAPQPLDDELLASLESYIVEKMEQLKVPGAAIAIVRGDEVVYSQGFGSRGPDNDEPITAQTQFMIGSTTKTMTTMLMAALVDAGLFDWDTPVIEVLPEFAVADPELSKQLTMRNLVCACTGVPRRDFEWIFEANELSAEDVVEQLESYELFTQFGEAFQYSNQMVSTAGYAAAAAAGAEWGNLDEGYVESLSEYVLDPIGMPDTTLSFEAVTERNNYATPHGVDLFGDFYPLSMDVERMLLTIAPAGGIWSTLDDMSRYLMTEINTGVAPDGTRVVSEENLSETWEPQVAITSDISYGLGWIVSDYKGLLVLSHEGNTFGFTTYIGFLPDAEIGFVILTNGRVTNLFNEAVRMRLMELLYAQPAEFEAMVQYSAEQTAAQYAEMPDDIGELDLDYVEPYVGRYVHPDLGEISIAMVDGELIIDAGDFQSTLLPYLAEGTEEGQLIMMEMPLAGVGVRLEQNDEGMRQIVVGGGVNRYVFVPVE